MALVLGRLDPPPQHPQHRVGDGGRGVLVGHAPLVRLPPPADLRLRRSQETLNKVLDGGAGLQQPQRLAHRRLAVPPRKGVDEPLHVSWRNVRLLHRLPPASQPIDKHTGHTDVHDRHEDGERWR
jgi:hypothetical protein